MVTPKTPTKSPTLGQRLRSKITDLIGGQQYAELLGENATLSEQLAVLQNAPAAAAAVVPAQGDSTSLAGQIKTLLTVHQPAPPPRVPVLQRLAEARLAPPVCASTPPSTPVLARAASGDFVAQIEACGDPKEKHRLCQARRTGQPLEPRADVSRLRVQLANATCPKEKHRLAMAIRGAAVVVAILLFSTVSALASDGAPEPSPLPPASPSAAADEAAVVQRREEEEIKATPLPGEDLDYGITSEQFAVLSEYDYLAGKLGERIDELNPTLIRQQRTLLGDQFLARPSLERFEALIAGWATDLDSHATAYAWRRLTDSVTTALGKMFYETIAPILRPAAAARLAYAESALAAQQEVEHKWRTEHAEMLGKEPVPKSARLEKLEIEVATSKQLCANLTSQSWCSEHPLPTAGEVLVELGIARESIAFCEVCRV